MNIRGEVFNRGIKTVAISSIVATIYDMNYMVGGSFSFPINPSVLIHGQSAAFDVSIGDDPRTPFNPFKDTSAIKYRLVWYNLQQQEQ